MNHRIGKSTILSIAREREKPSLYELLAPCSALTMHCLSVPCVKLPLAEGFVLFRFELYFASNAPYEDHTSRGWNYLLAYRGSNCLRGHYRRRTGGGFCNPLHPVWRLPLAPFRLLLRSTYLPNPRKGCFSLCFYMVMPGEQVGGSLIPESSLTSFLGIWFALGCPVSSVKCQVTRRS